MRARESFAGLLLSRRACVRLLAGGALCRAYADSSQDGPLTWAAEPAPDTGQERRYRADAQVVLLSLPLVRWPNVGGGSTVWRETSAARGVVRFLEFTGFSRPERAAGLNRLGFLREMTRMAPDGGSESVYFGLMTTSPEETAEQARKALHPTAKDAAYEAIDGHMAAGVVDTVVGHFTAPAHWGVANRQELIERAQASLTVAAKRPFAGDARGAALRPFLETLAAALRQKMPAEARFAYAGRPYHLWLEQTPDPKASVRYRQRGLIVKDAAVMQVTGRLRREAGGKESTFRLWVEHGAARPLPLRIEYRAKAYLRLIFEAEG